MTSVHVPLLDGPDKSTQVVPVGGNPISRASLGTRQEVS